MHPYPECRWQGRIPGHYPFLSGAELRLMFYAALNVMAGKINPLPVCVCAASTNLGSVNPWQSQVQKQRRNGDNYDKYI